ncbi:MAG: hypothetical protein J7L71_12175 [Spirochaetaceae bacterium]|nr:hypothetical protein [Spirochaetaceae bacterium]
MKNINLLKKIPLYLPAVLLLIFFSCTSGSKQTTVQDKDEENFQIPKLTQQEIVSSESDESEEYTLYNGIRDEGPVIPGIFQSAVPQGMAYYAEADLMFISNYMFDSRPSCITVLTMNDGLLKKILWIHNPDGSVHTGHVGGLAVSKKHLWIASGKGVYYVALEDPNALPNNSNLSMTAFVPTAAKASFATFSNGVLWVGEFTSMDGSYSVPVSHYFKTAEGHLNHAWLAGFRLGPLTDLMNQDNSVDGVANPNYILSIPDEVQGALFVDDRIILSQSYGRKNNSRISVYSNPLKDPADSSYTADDSRSIPVWILDESNFEQEIIAPPMTEGIVDYMGSAAVLFESGSDKYRASAKNPQDRIDILNISF